MELEAECSTQCDDDAGPFESTEQLDEVFCYSSYALSFNFMPNAPSYEF
jgi:hypothetical protein